MCSYIRRSLRQDCVTCTEFGTVLDTESEIMDLKIKKTKKSPGIVLQLDEQKKVYVSLTLSTAN